MNDVEGKNTIADIKSRVEAEHKVKVGEVSLKPNFSELVKDSDRLDKLGAKNGTMFHMKISGGVVVVGNTRRELDEKGNVVNIAADGKGVRPGLQALRDTKLQWTLTDMVELEDNYTYKIKGAKKDLCAKASLDMSACQSFQQYIAKSSYKTCRCGILYGKFIDSEAETERRNEEEAEKKRREANTGYGSTKKKMNLSDLDVKMKKEGGAKQAVVVEAIYEPPQEGTDKSFSLLEDPREAAVDAVANSLGLVRVGFIVSHPPSTDFVLNSTEICVGAEQSLEATQGERESPFVVVRVTLNEEGNVIFEPYTLTPTCLDMVAEGAIEPMIDNPSHCSVVSPFQAIVEAKEAHVIDNDFFIKSVPIVNHDSKVAGPTNSFPRFNRSLTEAPSNTALKNALKGIGRNPSPADLARALSDFHLLVYLSEVINPGSGLEDICKWVAKFAFAENSDGTGTLEPLQEGYKMLIMNMAGFS